MNGELHHACRLTAAIKYALAGETFFYEPFPYEQEPRFLFENGSMAVGGSSWMKQMQSKGLRDVLLLSPAAVKDRNHLAFSGGTQYGIASIIESGVTFWTADWTFRQEEKQWQITYREAPWTGAPEGKPVFDNPTDRFAAVLIEIEHLAEKLEEPNFANCFSKARAILSGAAPPTQQHIRLPERQARLFAAASGAWVFGGMCSWNDSPPYEAQQRGLAEEYERLSAALYSQIICAVLYAVNQW